MPDIHDVLRDGAGSPLAALDMDAVLARGAERTRNRRLAQTVLGGGVAAVALVVSLTIASNSTDKASVSPPLGAGATATEAPAGAAPKPQTTRASTIVIPDQLIYGIVHTVESDPIQLAGTNAPYGSVTFDEVTYHEATCKAAPPAQTLDYTKAFGICFTNVNRQLRAYPLAQHLTVTRSFEGNPAAQISIDQLAAYLPTNDGPGPSAVRVWKVTVKNGQVTTLEQFPVGGA